MEYALYDMCYIIQSIVFMQLSPDGYYGGQEVGSGTEKISKSPGE